MGFMAKNNRLLGLLQDTQQAGTMPCNFQFPDVVLYREARDLTG